MKALPNWISRLPFLVFLRISNTNIDRLPGWFLKLKSVQSIEANGSPCFIRDPKRDRPTSHHHATLVDISAARILEFIANGGDWTQTSELPDHLAERVMHSRPTRSNALQLLKNNYAGEKTFMFEGVRVSDLMLSHWKPLDRKIRKTGA